MSAVCLLLVGLISAAPAVEGPAQPQDGMSQAPLESSEPAPSRDAFVLGGFAEGGYLGSPGGDGAYLDLGARLGMGEHLAASVDYGYGILWTYPGVQDRWWLMPRLALVLDEGLLRWDVGLGAGWGTASGYANGSAYLASPFGPTWHYTLGVWGGYVELAAPLTSSSRVFLRGDWGSLILPAALRSSRDTSWFVLGVGLERDFL